MILSATTVFIIERRLFAAAGWMLAAAALSLLGLMHAWRFAGSDTIGSLPLLDVLTHSGKSGPWVPAAGFAVAYLDSRQALLFSARWLTKPAAQE